MFKRLDLDGNGQLSSAEMPDRVTRLRAMDEDNDGQVTREEMRSARQLGQQS